MEGNGFFGGETGFFFGCVFFLMGGEGIVFKVGGKIVEEKTGLRLNRMVLEERLFSRWTGCLT